MLRFVLLVSVVSSIFAYHIRPSEIVVDNLEIIEKSPRYHLSTTVLQELVKHELLERKVQAEGGTEAILNDYADKIFANIQNLIIQDGLDPLGMPEIHEGFNYTLIILYHGELDLTNGALSDLSTIHRGADVVVTYSSNTKYLEITVPIAFDDLKFTYDYSAKLMGLGPTGTIEGHINNLALEVKLGFNTQDLVFSLDEFYITQAGDIALTFHGDDLIDWLLDVLAFVATDVLKEVVLLVVEGVVRGGLQSAVDAINEAIGSLLNPTTTVPTTTPATFFFKT